LLLIRQPSKTLKGSQQSKLIGTVPSKDVLVAGQTSKELVQSRIDTQFKNLIAQIDNSEISFTALSKKANDNTLLTISSYLKANRESAYGKVTPIEEIKGWEKWIESSGCKSFDTTK